MVVLVVIRYPPPMKPNSTDHYDSTVNNLDNPSIFVTYQDNQVPPTTYHLPLGLMGGCWLTHVLACLPCLLWCCAVVGQAMPYYLVTYNSPFQKQHK